MTWCIAVKADIVVPVCPLKPGRCMWQHRETHACVHTAEEMTLQQWCAHVGLKGHPTEEQVGRFMLRLRKDLKEADGK